MSYAIVSVLGATEAAETVEIVNPILPVPNEMFWGAVFFFVLWALMKWVFLPPVQRTMQRRADVMRSDREAADTATALAAEEAANYEQSLASARAEAVRLIEQARGEAEQERRVVVGAAEDRGRRHAGCGCGRNRRSQSCCHVANARRRRLGGSECCVGGRQQGSRSRCPAVTCAAVPRPSQLGQLNGTRRTT